MGFFKRNSLIFLTTAFLLPTLVEALVYFKLWYFSQYKFWFMTACAYSFFSTSELHVVIGGLGVLYGLFGTLHFGIRRTIFWGLLLSFIGNLFGQILLWWGIAHFTPSYGVRPCPSSLDLYIAGNLSFFILVVCDWIVGVFMGIGAFCATLLTRIILRNFKNHLIKQ